MNNPWPALSVAATLVAVGIALALSHRRSWQQQQSDPTLEGRDRDFYRRRYRRRTQVAIMLALVGLLIGAGDLLLPFQKQQPRGASLYWIGVLLLTGWIVLLGLGDFWSSARFSRGELARVLEKQRDIERQIIEFKRSQFERTQADESGDGER